MSPAVVEILIALSVVGAGTLFAVSISAPRRDFAKSTGQRFAVENQAFISREFVGQFDRAVRFEFRLDTMAMSLYLATAFVTIRRFDFGGQFALGILGILIGLKALVTVIRLGREFRPAPDRLLIARQTSTQLVDYLHPLYLWSCAAAALVAAATAGWAAFNAFGGGDAYDSALTDGLPAAVVVSSTIVAAIATLAPIYLAALARRPIRAVDSASLYFQDAWRASKMRSTCYTIAFAGTMTGVFGVSNAVPEWALYLQLGLAIAPLGLFALADAKGRLWFRRRLWSTLACDQTLLPDQPVPDHAQ